MNSDRYEPSLGRSRWHLGLVFLASASLAPARAAVAGAPQPYSSDEREPLVGPIALHPNHLIASVLSSATYPLQVVPADRVLDAQRQYAAKDRNADEILEYAQKLGVSPGHHDGLYWPAHPARCEEASPFGPLVAASKPYRKGHQAGDSFRGDHFRIPTGQGRDAPGGAYSDRTNGHMLAGFAMTAYPDVYGQTAVLSFLISNSGILYQKNLGPRSSPVATAIQTFDPDHSSSRVADTLASPNKE